MVENKIEPKAEKSAFPEKTVVPSGEETTGKEALVEGETSGR